MGNWPWQKSKVIFTRKAGKSDYTKAGSYRPITLSSYIGKMFERILETRLRLFCEEHEILDAAQEGFRPRRSTVRYLYKLTSMLSEAKIRKLNAIILFIDFEKAFDSVWIKGLIIKLLHYGIKGKFLRLITKYLSNRCINLQVNDYIGINRICDMIGLPQGSILSPLLFIIFVADLLNSQELTPSAAKWTRTFKFADDGTVSVIHKDKKRCAKVENGHKLRKRKDRSDHPKNWDNR